MADGVREAALETQERDILLISLFDGIGGACRSFEILGVDCYYASSETDPRCQKVVRSKYPEVIELPPVEEISTAFVQDLALKYPRVNLVVVAGGPPCQGVAGLNASRRHLDDARSALMFVFVKVVALFKK